MPTSNRTLITLVENRPGVLNRVSSLIRRRGFNIESIAVGQSEVPGLARMVIVVDGATTVVDQVRKQLEKIIRVVKVIDISEENNVSRELVLVKVKSSPQTQTEIIRIAVDVFRAHVVDLTPDSIMIEVSGDLNKVNSLIDLFRGFGIIELTRTGVIAMTRGKIAPLQLAGADKPKNRKGTKPKEKS